MTEAVRYRCVADEGDSQGTLTYDAFGVLIGGTGSTANAYRYRGEQWDASVGMYYLRARWFEAFSGRFRTQDTAQPDLRDARTLHRYLYAAGDPVNAMDPTGTTNLFTYGSRLQKAVAVAGLVIVIADLVVCVIEDMHAILHAAGHPSGPEMRSNERKAGCLYHEHMEPPEPLPGPGRPYWPGQPWGGPPTPVR